MDTATRSIYLAHQKGGSVITLPDGRRRIVVGAPDLATALRDSIALDPVELDPEPAGRRIDVEAIDGGVIATLPSGEGPGEPFVIPDDSTAAAAQLWDALTATNPQRWLRDAEALAFQDGDDDDQVDVPIGDVAEIRLTRGQLRTGARVASGIRGFLQAVSRPGPRARARARKNGGGGNR